MFMCASCSRRPSDTPPDAVHQDLCQIPVREDKCSALSNGNHREVQAHSPIEGACAPGEVVVPPERGDGATAWHRSDSITADNAPWGKQVSLGAN